MSYSLKSGKAETLAWFQKNAENRQTVVDIGPGSKTRVHYIKDSYRKSQKSKLGVYWMER